tara:strand:- start:126 stop:758 length:633 start_codon:yes stop_codon:yes gene_type:complete
MSINFTKKEIIWIIIAILIGGFVIEMSEQLQLNLIGLLWAAIIILVSVFAKKITSSIYNIKIEHKIWSLKQFGWIKSAHFKKAVPMGLILPFFVSIVSLGIIKPFTLLQFDAENLKKKRVLRKRGAHRYSEINDSDLAFTSTWGFWALILLAIIASLIKQPELAKYSIYYGLWNLLPISQLDGSKLFFGSLINWVLLIIAYVISLVIILI